MCASRPALRTVVDGLDRDEWLTPVRRSCAGMAVESFFLFDA